MPVAVAEGVRRRGGDALTTQEAGRRGLSDGEQLAYATQQRRVVVTQDTDFLRLHATGITHHGIAYASPGLSIGEIIRGLMAMLEQMTADDLLDHVEFL